MCIIHNNMCSDNCCSRENIIIQRACIRRQLHFPCHRNLWLSSFLFWIIFYFLCLGHYSPSLATFFSSCNVYYLLSASCVHNLPTCTGHCDSLMCFCTWDTFHSFIHRTQCTFVGKQFCGKWHLSNSLNEHIKWLQLLVVS